MIRPADPENRSLIIWRESVAAGDDADAPHELKLPVHKDESIQSVITRIVSANYLASISGGRATWIVETGSRPLAVVAQQWPRARFLVEPEQDVTSAVNRSGGCHLYFKYWCQADPNLVYECLRDGKPLPSRYT